MDNSNKRKEHPTASAGVPKKSKKQWTFPRQIEGAPSGKREENIEAGETGFFATCDLHKEGKCRAELQEWFTDYAETLYGLDGGDDNEDQGDDIEAEIMKEVEGLQKPASSKPLLIAPKRLDTPCVIFVKTRSPVEPVHFVKSICEGASNGTVKRQSRFVRRLTPMTLMGKATEKGLQDVCDVVLEPHFHNNDGVQKKFAIRPSLRNHNKLTRDEIIRQVAQAVGPGHKVDLKAYDLLILVEVYKSVLGMSVVGPEYDKLKKYNLAEIYEGTFNPQEES